MEFLFTNENAEPVSFMSVAQVTAFQNGIELHKDEMFLERENCLMSIGIGAFAKKVAEDKKMVMYEYGGYRGCRL